MEDARAAKAEMLGIELLLCLEISAMKSDVLDCIHTGETYPNARSISSHANLPGCIAVVDWHRK